VKTLATAFMILAFSVTIAAWGYFSYQNARATLERTYTQQSDIVLNLSHQEYEDVIEQAERFLVRLSRSEELVDDEGAASRGDVLQIVQYGHNLFSKSKSFKLALADGAYFQEPAVVVPKSFVPGNQGWYREAIGRNGDIAWSDPYLDYFDQRIVVTASQAVRSNMAVFKGVAAIDFDLSEMSRLVGQSTIGDYGVVMLMNDNGEVLSNTNGYWLGESLFEHELERLTEATRSRHVEVSIHNETYLVKLKRIDENGMLVATAISVKRMNEQLWSTLLPVFLYGLLALSVFGGAAYLLLHRAFLWLEQFLELMRRAEQGDYSVHAAMAQYEETRTLSSGFNRMIEGIRQRDERLSEANRTLQLQEERLRRQYEELRHSERSLQQSEAEVRRLAYTDTLTGLLNRRSLHMKLEGLIRDRAEANHAVVYVDLDDFKTINDTLGHEAGDKVLAAVAHRLASLPHAPIHGARIGGDEFVFVLEDFGSIERPDLLWRQAIASLERPIDVGSKSYAVTASIGVAFYPEHGQDPDELLRNADLAMYKAKEKGKNRYAVYDESIRRDVARKSLLEHGTKEALRHGMFTLVFQPIYELRTGRIVSVETLLRCTSPEMSAFSIVDIIRSAEKTGQIVAIEQWVLRHAFEFAARLNRSAAQPVRVTVNLSAVHLAHPGFLQDIRHVLEETEVDPAWIGLEITETATMESFEAGRRKLAQLRDMRIPVLLDDFGTGYSSLTYLKDLPVDVVKIDKSFVDTLLTSKKDENVTSAIVQLAHHLGMRIVAEGVETKEQADKLAALSCDMVQGYYYSKPIPGEELLRTLAAGPAGEALEGARGSA
jgi:diguanylate cyclase (GGDEF)-like protein